MASPTITIVTQKLAKLHLNSKVAFSLEKLEPEYVLHLAAQNNPEFGSASKIAATSTEHAIRIFSADTLAQAGSITYAHALTITGVEFHPTDVNLLYTSAIDGSLRAWDLRVHCGNEASKKSKPVQEYRASEGVNDNFTCISLSCDGTLLATGTEGGESVQEVAVSLYDVRTGGNVPPVRYFNECHTEDITQVCFSRSEPRMLLSGATDGLVCCYDLNETDDDEAISATLSTESSVSRLGFCDARGSEKEGYIYALTHIETLHVWGAREDFDDVACVTNFREKFESELGVSYLVDCFSSRWLQDEENTTGNADSFNDTAMCVLAGTPNGEGHIFTLEPDRGNQNNDEQCALRHALTLPTGHSAIIRSAAYCASAQRLVTGGEDAMLCGWSRKEAEPISPAGESLKSESKLKSKVKQKVRKSGKPF